MSAITTKIIHLSNPFPFTLTTPPAIRPPHNTQHPPSPHAVDDDSNLAPEDSSAASIDPSFENWPAMIRLKYRNGTGKKAKLWRAKKVGGSGTAASKKKGGGVMLPPVALRKPMSMGGMEVELGFSSYSEWMNGRLAGLGLAALLLVELGAGKGLLAYHPAPIIFLQIYTVGAAGAMFVKYEKEKISVWPEKAPPAEQAGDGD